ncbi:metal-dependent transcriptional regulator [Oscillospiraceae bacterium PP1C4]
MQESGENYLETILMLENKNGVVRSIDIANELDYTKPSISRAMSILRKDGLITMEESGPIHLTALGREKANEIYERHLLLTRYLVITLGVDEHTASHDACRIEHVISAETFERVKAYVNAQKDA